MEGYVVVLVWLAIGWLVWSYLNHTDQPKIKNLPEIPGLPLFGNLLQLGEEHARRAAAWTKKYGPVFQVRLGNRRIVFVNDYETVKYFWINNQSSLISRPTLYTFHKVVSSSQGFTIGTSPWDESCKRKRKAAATALNRPAVQSYMPIIDLECTESIKELLADSEGGTKDLDPNAYFSRFALNTSLTLNYGFRIKGNIKNELLQEIIHVERVVGNIRSTSNNWQDYIPLLRLFGSSNKTAVEYRARRDVYMTKLLGDLQDRIANGTDIPCITGNILKDPEAKLNEAEIKSICLSMVSAGLDTVPGNLIMGMAYLSSAHGQHIQSRALAAINEVYPNGDAWEKCLVEEKVPYITALVKETLRFWSVIPICLPRTCIKDIPYKDSVIPAGTTFYMNAWAANYDEAHYPHPEQFNPDRFLVGADAKATSDADATSAAGTPHFGYGAGSRMCAGSHLANRELYTAYVRLVTAFEMGPATQPGAAAPILDALDCNTTKTSLTLDPKPFKMSFRPRELRTLRRWIEESEERTSKL